MLRIASAARSAEALAAAMGQVIVAREIGEFRHLAFKVERYGADRTVALLGDEDVGNVVNLFTVLEPAFVALVEFLGGLIRTLLRFGALVIVLLAIDEH